MRHASRAAEGAACAASRRGPAATAPTLGAPCPVLLTRLPHAGCSCRQRPPVRQLRWGFALSRRRALAGLRWQAAMCQSLRWRACRLGRRDRDRSLEQVHKLLRLEVHHTALQVFVLGTRAATEERSYHWHLCPPARVGGKGARRARVIKYHAAACAIKCRKPCITCQPSP
jgi:hypothetical protein